MTTADPSEVASQVAAWRSALTTLAVDGPADRRLRDRLTGALIAVKITCAETGVSAAPPVEGG